MIRLSQLTALDVSSTLLRDLDVSPRLYCYQSSNNNVTNSLLIQEDNSDLRQMTRKDALAPFWNNVLLGTGNFYPEQGLGITNFHNDSELHNKLSDISLPSIQYKKAFLYFSQGTILNPLTKGYWIRIYCKKSDGSEVTLCSVVDFNNDSNIKAKSSKLFESQIYNEALELEFVDVEYLINSPSSEVQELKQFLFGYDTPTTYFVQYSEFQEEGIDDFTENGYTFTSVNFKVINEQSFPITLQNDELLSRMELSNEGYAITSTLYHTKYNIESYLDKMKSSDENYLVTHIFNINEYDDNNNMIAQNIQMLSNPVDKFSPIVFRPLLSTNADHANIELTIKVENTNTGMTISRTSDIILTSDEVSKFMAMEQISLDVESPVINQIINRQVNKITPTIETPQIIQIEKRTYVQPQPLNKILLYNSKMTVSINTNTDLNIHKSLYLKIGDLLVQNNQQNINLFDVPQEAFTSNEKQYLLLDENKKLISVGEILRNTDKKLSVTVVNDVINEQQNELSFSSLSTSPIKTTGGVKSAPKPIIKVNTINNISENI